MAETEADYEDFLQAFERPTQIYRYLRTYHEKSPCFLQRSLSYMRYGPRVRTSKNRPDTCSLNDLRHRKAVLDRSVVSTDGIRSGGPLELSFLLFSDDCGIKCGDALPSEAIVEVSLHKEGFRRAKESLGSSTDEMPLGTYSVPCNWRQGGTASGSSSSAAAASRSGNLESVVVVPLGLFGFSMLGGLGVKRQKLLFKVHFEPERGTSPSTGRRAFSKSPMTGLVMSPAPSSLSCTSSSPATFATANGSSPAVPQFNSMGESTGSSSSLMDTSPPAAKRHCVASVFSDEPVANGHSPENARVIATADSLPSMTGSVHSPLTADAYAATGADGGCLMSGTDLPRPPQNHSDLYGRQMPMHRRQHNGSEEDGLVDWSQWSGELTQSSAAVNRKVQPLLRKNRELRGLVLDDPPDNSGLPEFSYARGRRGYTKSTPSYSSMLSSLAAPKLNGAGGGGKSSHGESPARTPSPPTQASPSWRSDHGDRCYYVELPLADETKTCLLEAGHYDVTMRREENAAVASREHAERGAGIDALFPCPFEAWDADSVADCSTSAASSATHPSQQPVWESLPQPLHSLPGVEGPSLRFVVTWPQGKPEFLQLAAAPRTNSSSADRAYPCTSSSTTSRLAPPHTVVYNFVYRNGQCQQTESSNKLTCPWCHVACPHIYSLLKHLHLNHPRFNFSVVQRSQSYEIDVCLNRRYDVFFDSDIHPARRCDPRTMRTVRAPRKRSSFTKAFFGQRGRRLKFDVTEFQLLGGEGRMFFHCRTSLPILPSEADEDSEDEVTPPEWISTKMTDLLNEFTDVNDGEKAIMKLWNDYVLKERVNVDTEIPAACVSFTRLHASTIHRYGLHRNFLLHLSTLCDFGLIGQDCLKECYAGVPRSRPSAGDADDEPGQ